MNISFVTLGLCMTLGALLLYRYHGKSTASKVGFGLLALAGLGTALVGLFPENTVAPLHVMGAAMPFLLGNIALVLLGFTLRAPHVLRLYTTVSGLVALSALVLFLTHTYLGIGIGGMERITAYPQTIWLIVFGLHTLRQLRDR
jgi:hypothetical membrane protein